MILYRMKLVGIIIDKKFFESEDRKILDFKKDIYQHQKNHFSEFYENLILIEKI
jgi:hypothetical protein